MDRNEGEASNNANCSYVALRKESVDRNPVSDSQAYKMLGVALRKESVDRNIYENNKSMSKASRSPQGERG